MNKYIILIFILLIIKISTTPSCIIYSNYCQKCNQLTNLCSICEKRDIFIPDDKGGCIGAKKCIIGKNYCNECDSGEKLCKLCDEGFYPDENGGCTLTNNCKISYKGQCLECNENFILIGGNNKFKFCKSVLSNDFLNCKEIDILNGECKTCEENFYLNKGDKRCIQTENCYESIFGNCILCNDGYYLNKKDNKCIKKDGKNEIFENCKQTLDGENCEICNLDYYFDDNGICTYSNYCSESKNKKCEKCKNGYYLTKGNICSNSENCYYADKDTGLCITCNPNYYLDTKDYKCKSNFEEEEYKYCIQVIDNKCSNCESKFRLGEDNKCSKTLNCSETENGSCIKCSNGYYLGLDGMCTKVERCIYSKDYECIECENNYYYNQLEKKCLEAKGIYEGCQISTFYGTFCSKCREGYYLDLNDYSCYKDN